MLYVYPGLAGYEWWYSRIGHLFFVLLLGFVTIASILVCISQANKAGDPRASCGGSNSLGDPVGGIMCVYTAYVKSD